MTMAAPGQLNVIESPSRGSCSIGCFEKLEHIGEGTYGEFLPKTHLMLSTSGLIHYHVIPRVYPSTIHHMSFRPRKSVSSNNKMKKMPSVLKCIIHYRIHVFP